MQICNKYKKISAYEKNSTTRFLIKIEDYLNDMIEGLI